MNIDKRRFQKANERRRKGFAGAALALLMAGAGSPFLTPITDAEGQSPSPDTQKTVAEIYRDSISHIFTIHTTVGLGTGFAYSWTSDFIATNAHVVGNDTTVDVETQDGQHFTATVFAKDVDLDWALLKPVGIPPFLSMWQLPQGQTPAIGEAIVVIGSPGGLKGSVTTGIVSQIFPDGIIQLNAAINHGNSGGPVFNMKGQVFGIATAKYKNGDGIGFAIPLSRIVR